MSLPPLNPNPPALAVVAIGGNSLIQNRSHQSIPHQWEAVRKTAIHIVDMVELNWRIVITHGNGPQVGFILRKNELSKDYVHTIPLDIIVSNTQGSIGYMIQQAISNECQRRGIERASTAILTQTLVDKDDPAFQQPTKPIGRFLQRHEAAAYEAEGWTVVEDAGRGWRRAVASPKPLEIVEQQQIRHAVERGEIVIAVGGGGIPVVRNRHRELRGVEAVVDKDLASALLAAKLGASLLLISTGVEKVALHFGKPEQRDLNHLTLTQARQYVRQGHFAPGSMQPKIEGCIDFIEATTATDASAIITSPDHLVDALRGISGTRISRGA